MEKKIFIYTLIGLFIGGIFPLFIQNIEENLLFININFSIQFGVLGFFIGAILCPLLKITKNKIMNFFIIQMTFILSGISYGCLLSLRFNSDQNLSFLPLDIITIPMGVSVFVYIFCICFMALGENLNKGIILTIFFALPLLVLSFPKIYLFSFPTYLVFVTFINLAINHLGKRKLPNILRNLLLIFLIYSIILILTIFFSISADKFSKNAIIIAIAIGSCFLPLIGIILYFFELKGKNEVEKNEPTIDSKWIFSSASLLSNYILITSPISFFNYLSSANIFEKIGILSNIQKKVGIYFSFSTFIIQFIFMVYNKFNLIIHPSYIWSICVGIACFTLSYSFHILNENSIN